MCIKKLVECFSKPITQARRWCSVVSFYRCRMIRIVMCLDRVSVTATRCVYLLRTLWRVPTVKTVCVALFSHISCVAAAIWTVLLFNWLGSVLSKVLLQTARPGPLGGMSSLHRQPYTKGSVLWQHALTSWHDSANDQQHRPMEQHIQAHGRTHSYTPMIYFPSSG